MPRDAAPVSVIIPAFNAAKSIERALRSVALQTLPPSEVIVVDDGSSDDTTAVAKAMQDEFHETQLVVISQPNKGAGAARNRAVEAATELYVAFLDADDEWEVEFLHTIINLKKHFVGAAVFSTNYFFCNQTIMV